MKTVKKSTRNKTQQRIQVSFEASSTAERANRKFDRNKGKDISLESGGRFNSDDHIFGRLQQWEDGLVQQVTLTGGKLHTNPAPNQPDNSPADDPVTVSIVF